MISVSSKTKTVFLFLLILPTFSYISGTENESQVTAKLDENAVVSRIYQLEHIKPSEMADILEPLISKSGQMTIEEEKGTLVVFDKLENQKRFEAIIEKFDIEAAEFHQGGIFPVTNSDPNEIRQIIRILLDVSGADKDRRIPGRITGRTNRRRVVADSSSAASKQSGRITESHEVTNSLPSDVITADEQQVILVPHPEIKMIIAIGSTELLEKTEKRLQELDSEAPVISEDQSLSQLDKDQIIPKIFQLENNNPVQLFQIIDPLISKSGHISVNEYTNTLLVADTAENLKRFEKIIFDFDLAAGKDYHQQVFEIRHGDPNEIVQLVRLRLLRNPTKMNSFAKHLFPDLFSSGSIAINGWPIVLIPYSERKMIIARAPVEILEQIKQWINELSDNQEDTGYDIIQFEHADVNNAIAKLNEFLMEMGIDTTKRISIQPLISSKQILIFGDEADRKLVKRLIQDIEEQSTDKSLDFERIPIKYGDVVEIADVLTKIMEELTPDFRRRISIYALAPSNQLLVFGKKQYRDMVKKLIEEIDYPQNQLQRETFKLKHADPNEIQVIINEIYGNDSSY